MANTPEFHHGPPLRPHVYECNSPVVPTWADVLRQAKDAKNWSGRRLAREAGVDPGTVSGINRGKHQPDRQTLEKIAKAVGWTVEELYKRQRGEAEPAPSDANPTGRGGSMDQFDTQRLQAILMLLSEDDRLDILREATRRAVRTLAEEADASDDKKGA